MKTLLHTLRTAIMVVVLTFTASPAHAAPGDLDPLNANIVGNFVFATAVQPDGKTIIAGSFTSVLGVPRNNIARLNADGTLDMGFNPNVNSHVRSVAVQADGKVLLGGDFSTLQPNGALTTTTRSRIARVNADGTLDTGFDPNANSNVLSVAVQGDGKVLLGGTFTSLQPNGAATATPRICIARVNADGTLDTGFDPKANSAVYSVAVQGDGNVLLGGGFTSLQPNGALTTTTRNRIARVNADGTLDTGFDPNASSTVFSVAVQADGKVLLGGQFSTLQPNGAATGTPRNRIARVNADGTLDTGFDPKANNSVFSVAVQADGKVLLGGFFSTLQPNGALTATTRNRIARVNADGTLDTGFDPKANNEVYSVPVQADGKVLLGGSFTSLQPNGAAVATTRNLFARLENDPATQTLTVPDATQTLWTRGGAAPELSRVTFELSTDGGTTWGTPLAGTRIGTTPNWQRTALTLPASGHLRARGVTTGGIYSSSSGLIEQVVAFNIDTTAPTLSLPANIMAEATSAAGATVTYTASASDAGSGVATSSFLPASGSVFALGTTTVNASATDNVGNTATGSFTVTVADTIAPTIVGPFAPLSIVAGTPLPDFLEQATTSDAVGVTSGTQSPAPASATAAGTIAVTLTVEDAAGNTGDVSFNVTVTPADPVATALYTKGGAVPDAGTDARIQAGAVWTSLGTPAVNTAGSVALFAKWSAPKVEGVAPLPAQTGSGIFVDGELLVKVGDAVPGMSGVAFKSFKSPVLNAEGDVGFLATVSGTGITSTNDSVAVLYTTSTTAAAELRVVAQEGTAAPTGDGALWKSFKSLAVSASGISTAYSVEGRLLVPSGTPAVTAGDDAVVVAGGISSYAGGPFPAFVALREGGSVLGAEPGETLKSWRFLAAVSGSAGQGRALNDSEFPTVQATLSTGRQAVVSAAGGPAEAVLLGGDLVESATLDTAKWKTFGAFSTSAFGAYAMKAGLLSGTGGVTSADATGVFLLDTNTPGGWVSVARFADAAPGLPVGAVFSAMRDPVLAADGLGIAFAGTAKDGGLVSTNDQGIWWKPAGEPLALLAREGAQPPAAPAGAEWKSFSSLAMPGGASGPLFTAKLRIGTAGAAGPGGITSADDVALYGTDSAGSLRELVREGQPLLGKTVKTFNVLKAASGTAGSTRAFNNDGEIVLLVSYDDATTGIVRITLP